MARGSQNMVEIALELAAHDPSYEGMATKFLEHFLFIASAMMLVPVLLQGEARNWGAGLQMQQRGQNGPECGFHPRRSGERGRKKGPDVAVRAFGVLGEDA